jgi:small GTP-binding protein
MARLTLKSKVCLVGESAVGKTSLIRKFVLNSFDDQYISTIGTKVCKKPMVFEHAGVQVAIDMMIWDIMGQSSFRTLLQDAYFYGASGIIAVCDATRRETLSALDGWVESVRQVAGDVPMVMLANKSDLKAQVQVSESDLELKARRHKASSWHFTSAKTGENVAEAFQAIGASLVQRQYKGAR